MQQYFILALIIVSITIKSCLSCVSEERRALLDFKASINEMQYPHLILPSWIDDDDDPVTVGSEYCCEYWEGVICNNTTGRIVELHLRDFGIFDSQNCFLNLSILLPPLNHLQSLDLSFNSLPTTGIDCEGLSNFKNLQSLNLDVNNFDNNMLYCVTPISSLKNLSLASNYLNGSFPSKEINDLKQLEHLDLSFNDFSGFLSFKELMLENLEFLNLEHTNMILLSSLEVMASLKVLYLAKNNFNDSSIFQGICSLKNLVELDLGNNDFSGNIPLCLSNLTSLKFLDISYNNFSGSIPPLVITCLIHLEYLSLRGNCFEGSFPFTLFSNHSKLWAFELGPLWSGLHLDSEALPLPPPFQLRVLRLPGCNLNKVPNFLFYQKQLRVLDLSSNNLVGKIPNWLFQNNPALVSLILRNNSFTGQILSDSMPKLQDLQKLDISNNKVGGQAPQDIGLFFPSLEYLNLSRNYFQGSIPESLGYLKVASAIDLSHNNFSGEVPDQIGTRCANLLYLLLSNNSLQGQFPSSSMNLTGLRVLYLDNNHFAGSISPGLSRSHQLMYLHMSNNMFQGKIPSWIGNFSNLQTLDLSQNQLEGTIPDDICKLNMLMFLDLSVNRFNGSIPPCSSLSSLRFIHLQWNQITGSIPNALLEGSKDLMTVDLRHNRLSGGIPHNIATLAQLRVLLLGGNNLQDQIPVSICQLKNLSILDLSQNNFSGGLPSCLSNISFRANFSLFLNEWFTLLFYVPIMPPIGYKTSFDLNPFAWNKRDEIPFFDVQEIVEFRTKSRINTYSGDILNYMSGMDLSCNQLTGEIPPELGDVNGIRALNLSHNHLQGSIPSTLSMLNLIESLDLSYNNLSGQIPYELTYLNFMSIFNVSYNNLSGRTPENGQFANFDESNYRGNPNLCGPLLHRDCESITGIAEPLHHVDGEENDGGIDMVGFIWGFSASLIATLALSLYLSPDYRRVWSDFKDKWIL